MTKRKPGEKRKPLDSTSQKSDISGVARACPTQIIIYQEKPGVVPLFELTENLKKRDRFGVIAAIEELQKLGHEMRPPHNEHLGGQLYYLRVRGEDGTYRVFYWPFGKGIVILGHGFSKKSDSCPQSEIDRARKMRDRFTANPKAHTYGGDVHDKDE